MNKQHHYRKIGIITCCLDDWGGSEDLWARSVPILFEENIKDIIIYKKRINKHHPEFIRLAEQGVQFRELDPILPAGKRLLVKVSNLCARAGNRLGLCTYNWNRPVNTLHSLLEADRPDIVLVSQGINFDGLAYAYQCHRLNIPYSIVSHKAVAFYWPQPGDRAYMKEALLNARKCFFVSQHNKTLTEEQFGIRIPQSHIIFNPVKTKPIALRYPSTDKGYRLACVGRLFIIDKGQDILLRVLAQPKWKERPITISFFGTGPDEDGLKEMASLLNVENITFCGRNDDLHTIWANHHALILPSRSEGLPLTIVEAMSLGRTVIVSDAGGNAELIEPGVTGFTGAANEKDIDILLEEAWSKRNDWEVMGIQASKFISTHIPEKPEKIFTSLLTDQ
jgi:glycosyltransferase involved in cell wall biosynthesis